MPAHVGQETVNAFIVHPHEFRAGGCVSVGYSPSEFFIASPHGRPDQVSLFRLLYTLLDDNARQGVGKSGNRGRTSLPMPADAGMSQDEHPPREDDFEVTRRSCRRASSA
jgi:hypothetical protein